MNMLNSTNFSEKEYLKLWTIFLQKVMESDSVEFKIIISAVLIIFFVIGLFGNVLTCMVIYYDKTMHTATNSYLFNMAVSDIVVSFAIFLEVYLFLCEAHDYGNIACKVHYFFEIAMFNNGILIVTVLAIERYIAIWHPLMLDLSRARKRVTRVIKIIWIIVILETTPEVLSVELIRTSQLAMCFTVPTPFSRVVNGILAVMTFIIPLGVMLFVYTMIAFKVNTNEKSNSKRKIFNHKDNRRKVNKLVVAITLSFVICWLPIFTLRILIFSFDTSELLKLDKLWNVGYKVILVNSWLSIVLNPILFSLMSTKFRKALKTLWNNKAEKQQYNKELKTNNDYQEETRKYIAILKINNVMEESEERLDSQ